jgi:Tol biopolymer transport system component
MRKILPLALTLFMVLGLAGCSIDVSQPAPTSPSPSSNGGAAAATPDGAAASAPLPSGSSRPVTWASLHLTGRLVYSRLSSDNDVPALSIETLDLATGEIRKVFTASEDARIYYSAVSPDGKEVILSYVPSSVSGAPRSQALYRVPMDGSAPPALVVIPPTEYDQYLQVEWSSDGKYLYFVHNNYHIQPADQIYPNYTIFRMAYPDGQPEQIVEHAFWPRVSPDSSKLVYVSLDPASGANQLFLANADGTNAQVIDTGSLQDQGIVDAPFFSPDGQSIFLSAPSPVQSYQPNWVDRLMGVQIAKAHNLPSDWWVVPITGGEPARLTQIQSINLFGRMSPDGRHMVSFGMESLFVMEPDGSNLTYIIPDSGGSTVDWLP